MRETWTETTLGEVTELNPEATKNFRKDQAIRYIDLSSVSHETGISQDLSEVNYGDAPGRARRVVRADDVLVSTVRPYLKGFAQVPQHLDGEVASTGFTVVRAKQDKTLAGFVWALVGTETFVRHLMDRATGSNYPAVRPEDIASFTFMLPPVALQRRIVNLLSSIDSYITALQQQTDAARVARAAVLSKLLSAGGEDWTETSVSSLLTRSIGGVWGTEPGTDQEEVTVVRSTEFTKSGVLNVVTGVPRSIKSSQLSSRELAEGDILLEKSGGGPEQPVGRVVYVQSDIPPRFVCSNFIQLLTPSQEKVVPRFLFLVMWLWHFENKTLEYQAQTTGIRNLRTPDYLEQSIGLPPLAEQRRIVEVVSSMDVVIQSTDRAVADAKHLRSGLLSELLSGEHEIPESYDRLLGAA